VPYARQSPIGEQSELAQVSGRQHATKCVHAPPEAKANDVSKDMTQIGVCDQVVKVCVGVILPMTEIRRRWQGNQFAAPQACRRLARVDGVLPGDLQKSGSSRLRIDHGNTVVAFFGILIRPCGNELIFQLDGFPSKP